MRSRYPAATVVGSASSVAATTAVLPLSKPVESDPVMLLVVWVTAALAADGLVQAGRRRLMIALTRLLTLVCLLTLAIETIRLRRWERPGVLIALLAICLLCFATDAAAPRRPRRPKIGTDERPDPPPGGRQPTRPLPYPTTTPARILNGRWLVEPGPLTDADPAGFGVLCRATDLRQRRRKVVVKLAMRSFDTNDNSVARLQREGELLARLDSPCVIGLRDRGWEAGAFFLVLDYHPAGSLARWLDNRFVLKLSTVLQVVDELLGALAYLHEATDRPLIHRDLTPRNVLVRAEWPTLRLLLTDFGSARYQIPHGPGSESTVTMGSVFSPYYAAPELVGGPDLGFWGPETDIYGACAILYELLSGLPPYQREARRRGVEFQRLVLDPASAPVPPSRVASGLPPILDHVVAYGLAQEPGARPARAEDLRNLLEDIGRRHGTVRIPVADLRRSP